MKDDSCTSIEDKREVHSQEEDDDNEKSEFNPPSFVKALSKQRNIYISSDVFRIDPIPIDIFVTLADLRVKIDTLLKGRWYRYSEGYHFLLDYEDVVEKDEEKNIHAFFLINKRVVRIRSDNEIQKNDKSGNFSTSTDKSSVESNVEETKPPSQTTTSHHCGLKEVCKDSDSSDITKTKCLAAMDQKVSYDDRNNGNENTAETHALLDEAINETNKNEDKSPPVTLSSPTIGTRSQTVCDDGKNVRSKKCSPKSVTKAP